MNFIANRSLNLGQSISNHLCFNIVEHCLFLYDVLNIKKNICSSVSDHNDNSTLKNKKPIKKLLVLKRTKFHVELRNY